MLPHRLISATVSTVLLATGVLGGVAGNAVTAQNLDDLAARENVTTIVEQNLSTTDYIAGTQARATLDAFAPAIEAAAALVESSAGKASDAARAALSDLLSEIEVKTAAHVETGAEAREAATQIVATGTPALAAASQTVNDEVAAWQAAEDARIAAEKAAAEEAAAREVERSYGGDSGYSPNSNGGSNGGSSNGGGDRAEQWRQIAAGQGIDCFSVIPGGTSYYSSGCIQIGQNPLNANSERVLWHEIAHHYTAGLHSYTVACTRLARELGGDIEVWAQAWTQVNLGWSMPQYPSASQSFIDGMRNAGCGI